MVKEITDDGFYKEVLSSDLPVLLLGYASWCVDSRRILPVFERVSTLPEFRDIRFLQVEVERGTGSGAKLGIEKLPTLYSFIDGKRVEERIAEVSTREQEEIIRGLALRAKKIAAGQTV